MNYREPIRYWRRICFFLGPMVCLIFLLSSLHGFSSVYAADPARSRDTGVVEEQQRPEKGVDETVPDRSTAEKKPSDEYDNVTEEQVVSGEGPRVADPLESWNRAVYHFNDKVYFWALKPVAKGYKYILPEGVRGLFSSFYQNIKAPIRIANNLLQGELGYAGIELAKLLINSTVGVGGLRDCATECFNIKGRNADFGQTLGIYGMGHGFYLVWPFLGPSSARDSVGWGVDWSLKPTTYLGGSEWINVENVGLYVHESVNTTSFHIGDYETLKGAAIDPYVAMRDAYIQYRAKALKK
ncbi:MAG: VacJ family lipoprotein [Proteobacteria bacterium]|nr:VacJ family lipoprotein [Pseudomonadota bacterium]